MDHNCVAIIWLLKLHRPVTHAIIPLMLISSCYGSQLTLQLLSVPAMTAKLTLQLLSIPAMIAKLYLSVPASLILASYMY